MNIGTALSGVWKLLSWTWEYIKKLHDVLYPLTSWIIKMLEMTGVMLIGLVVFLWDIGSRIMSAFLMMGQAGHAAATGQDMLQAMNITDPSPSAQFAADLFQITLAVIPFPEVFTSITACAAMYFTAVAIRSVKAWIPTLA